MVHINITLGIGKLKRDGELKGYIDEFYIFNRSLSQPEIKDIHIACKGPKASQIINLDFKEINGTKTEDASFQGNDGHFIGDVQPGKELSSYTLIYLLSSIYG